MKSRLLSLYSLERLHWSLWIFLLVSIPLTSSPLVSFVTGGSTVSPLAGVPLILLLVLWYIPHFLLEGRLPKVSMPLLLFVGAALFSTVLGLFYEIYPFLGQGPFERGLRAAITLLLGVGFYLVAASYPQTRERLARSLRWLYVGAGFMLLWSTVQIIFVFRNASIPRGIWLFHRLLSNRDMLYTRVTGMAYEPSWLANLLVVLYLPLLLASVIQGYSAFSKRTRRISIELGLLIWGVIVLFLSLSRIGLISFFTVLGGLGLVASWRLTGKWMRMDRPLQEFESAWRKLWLRQTLRLVLWLLFILMGLLIVYGIILLASRLDPRIERIFRIDFLLAIRNSPTPIFAIANLMAYAERVMFWTIGLRVFAHFPILGVGLGNTGFFFREFTPAFSYYLPEVVRILTGAAEFPNPKNLWVRLLAETGIVGFSLFVLWLILMALGAWTLVKKGKGLNAVLGLAALMAILAQFWEGFSLDSFALPQLWIILGFMTAAISVHFRAKPHADVSDVSMDLNA